MSDRTPVPGDALAACVAALADDLVALRRDLHAHPELSWEEHRTTAAIIDFLAARGLTGTAGPTGTGVICDVGTVAPDTASVGFVVIRADLDALAMADMKDVPYRSTVDGVCHSCGHDVHAAAVAGAGVALAEAFRSGEVNGGVRLIFQPAEEAIPGGARPLQEAGLTRGAAAILGLHCAPQFAVGTVGLSPGPITSAADVIEIVLHGPGGHTARGHRTADLVHIAARVVVDLPMGMARLSDSRDGLNLTFGSIAAGNAANVIPTTARIRGSLRAVGRESWERAPERVESLLRAIVEPLGATFELNYRRGSPPVENDPALVELMAGVARGQLGDAAVGPTEQSAGGEDFSWYLHDAPGCYVRLGVRAPGAPMIDIHAGAFDVDERAITIGAELLARTALEALQTAR